MGKEILLDIMRKRKLSAKQRATKIAINKKVLLNMQRKPSQG